MFNFLINYPHIIFKVIILLLGTLTLLKYVKPNTLKKLELSTLLYLTLVVQLVYAFSLTVLQYILWKGNQVTEMFTTLPITDEVPLGYLSFLRPILDNTHGYFAFYAFNKFFMSFLILYFVTLIFATILLTWKHFKTSSLTKFDIFAIIIALFVSGWPYVLTLIPLAFAFIITIYLVRAFFRFEVNKNILPITFIVLSIIHLLFGQNILEHFKLLTTLLV